MSRLITLLFATLYLLSISFISTNAEKCNRRKMLFRYYPVLFNPKLQSCINVATAQLGSLTRFPTQEEISEICRSDCCLDIVNEINSIGVKNCTVKVKNQEINILDKFEDIFQACHPTAYGR